MLSTGTSQPVLWGLVWGTVTLYSPPAGAACLFGSVCDYPCHCRNNATCDVTDGSCPDGCDDGDIGDSADLWHTGGWGGYGCQMDRQVETYVEVGTMPEYGDGNGYNLCHFIESWNGNTYLSVDCGVPLKGRYVRLTRRVGSFSYNFNLLCEVQVFGYIYHACPSDRFGVACGTPCNCHAACDDLTGLCPDLNCTSGWKGDNCQDVCEAGLWGPRCQLQCQCLEAGEVCDHATGRCLSGCAHGYGGQACQRALPYMSSIVHVSDITAGSLHVDFTGWSDNAGAGSVPEGYMIQWRVDGNPTGKEGPWNNALAIRHAETESHFSGYVSGLRSQMVYRIRVVPFFIDGGIQYDGEPSREFGPYMTDTMCNHSKH